jgi:hypothetical protein
MQEEEEKCNKRIQTAFQLEIIMSIEIIAEHIATET